MLFLLLNKTCRYIKVKKSNVLLKDFTLNIYLRILYREIKYFISTNIHDDNIKIGKTGEEK